MWQKHDLNTELLNGRSVSLTRQHGPVREYEFVILNGVRYVHTLRIVRTGPTRRYLVQ